MPIFKAVSESYWNWKDLKNLVNYAAIGKDRTQNVCGAQGVLLGDPGSMYRQMEDVKKQFHKEKNRKALHYILSFSKEEEAYIGAKEALRIGYLVASFFRGRQVVFGIHDDTDNLHIHFVVNSTSYENGLAFCMGPADLQELKEYINAEVRRYYIRILPEAERRETVCGKAGQMMEMDICRSGIVAGIEPCSAGDSQGKKERLFDRL